MPLFFRGTKFKRLQANAPPLRWTAICQTTNHFSSVLQDPSANKLEFSNILINHFYSLTVFRTLKTCAMVGEEHDEYWPPNKQISRSKEKRCQQDYVTFYRIPDFRCDSITGKCWTNNKDAKFGVRKPPNPLSWSPNQRFPSQHLKPTQSPHTHARM